jgi:formate dehydrogenase major subunit
VLLKKLVGRTDRRREEGGRGQELEDRPVGRHHPRGHEEPRLPSVRQRQGAGRGLELPDPIPQHREPLYSTRPDMVAKYPTHDDKKAFWRLPTLYKTVQQRNIENKVYEKFPIILTSGRLVEYEGGGEETRSNPWLAELQQEMFVEINPKAATNAASATATTCWVKTPTGARIKVRALVTERVGVDTAFIPFHFSGWWQGKDLKYYPEGAMPIVRGEAVNTATTYGYDSVTMMQETKTTFARSNGSHKDGDANGPHEIHL